MREYTKIRKTKAIPISTYGKNKIVPKALKYIAIIKGIKLMSNSSGFTYKACVYKEV